MQSLQLIKISSQSSDGFTIELKSVHAPRPLGSKGFRFVPEPHLFGGSVWDYIDRVECRQTVTLLKYIFLGTSGFRLP